MKGDGRERREERGCKRERKRKGREEVGGKSRDGREGRVNSDWKKVRRS
jgi:hypothetical protein